VTLSVVPLESARCGDFYRVHGDAHDTGWCFCVAWWVPTWDNWGDRTTGENRDLRNLLFDRGQYDGYLLYRDDEAVGWCQCGPRDRLTKLCQQYDLEPDTTVWAITCFVLTPPVRQQGLAHHLLREMLRDLKCQGVRHVQGFPRRGDGLDSGEVWTGPESLFQKAGFTIEGHAPRGPIYGKQL
jgi:GNAT superfamily N-acetyltransferase